MGCARRDRARVNCRIADASFETQSDDTNIDSALAQFRRILSIVSPSPGLGWSGARAQPGMIRRREGVRTTFAALDTRSCAADTAMGVAMPASGVATSALTDPPPKPTVPTPPQTGGEQYALSHANSRRRRVGGESVAGKVSEELAQDGALAIVAMLGIAVYIWVASVAGRGRGAVTCSTSVR